MSRKKAVKFGFGGAGFFAIALGAGIIVGAGFAIALLEIREYANRAIALAKRERELARMMVDVVGDFTGLGAGMLPGRGKGLGELGGDPAVQEQLRQRMKTRLRKGEAGMADSERTEEMDLLYSDMQPEAG
ncbi:MAG: hypothetical protein HRF49_10140 [bacterium]|jgi:hypothetical protein